MKMASSPLLIPLASALLAAGVITSYAVPLHAAASPDSEQVRYLAFEGNTGRSESELPALKQILGPLNRRSTHLYAYSASGIPFLTRSVKTIQAEVNTVFEQAETEDVPVMFHIDPLYAFDADTERNPEEAPELKYWKDPETREWIEFPVHAHTPDRIPRAWFNWGCWASSSPAVPALGAPKFLSFAKSQMTDALAKPIAARVAKLNAEGKGYLFAGLNVGWETNVFDYGYIDAKTSPVAQAPSYAVGVKMQPWEIGAKLGYASLYWQGWNQEKLQAEATRQGISAEDLFHNLIYKIVHDYMETLAKACVDQGLSKDKIYTHIVPMTTVNPAMAKSGTPPIWVAVNPDSIPGFTMDAKGAAVYDLQVLKKQIQEADSTQTHFAAIESYLNDYRNGQELTALLNQLYGNGCVMKVLFGVMAKGTPFELEPEPAEDTVAIKTWLKAGFQDENKR